MTYTMVMIETHDTELLKLFDIKPSKGDIKRMEIIQAAIECLATVGFDKTTYEAIAKVVGTRRAHINYYFADKNDIFMSCVKYISANYQQISFNHVEKAKTSEQMLLHYIEGPFLWASKHHHELSVMMLLYYLATVKPEYQALNKKIRKGGAERIQYILREKIGLPAKEATILSKTIQNLISGNMLDSITTNATSLKTAESKTKKTVLKLIEAAKAKGVPQ